jgi:hypothetical protein
VGVAGRPLTHNPRLRVSCFELQGQLSLSCLLEAPLAECSASGVLSHSRHLSDVYVAPTPTALPSIAPTITSATISDGTPVPLASGALPATLARGSGCDNMLQSAELTVLTNPQGAIEAVNAAVVLGSAVADSEGAVATRPSFSLVFRDVAASVRAVLASLQSQSDLETRCVAHALELLILCSLSACLAGLQRQLVLDALASLFAKAAVAIRRKARSR